MSGVDSPAPAPSGPPTSPPTKPKEEKKARTVAQNTYPDTASSYKLHEELGTGSSNSAHIYRATCSALHDKEVAIRVVDLESAEIEGVMKEVKAMRNCEHPNIRRIHTTFVHEDKLWLVLEYYDCGSCVDLLRIHNGPTLGFQDEDMIAAILKQVLDGLHYVHSNGLMHRDIKGNNILVDSLGTIHLTDFGLSTFFEDVDARRVSKTFVGTVCWMAPEVMEQGSGYDVKVDIWSFGITCLELAHGRAPLSHYPPMKVMLKIMQAPTPTLENPFQAEDEPRANQTKRNFSKSFKEVVDACLQKDPRKRPTAEQLLQMKFFKSAKGTDYVRDKLIKDLPRDWRKRMEENKAREASLHRVVKAVKTLKAGSSHGSMSWDFDIDEHKAELVDIATKEQQQSAGQNGTAAAPNAPGRKSGTPVSASNGPSTPPRGQAEGLPPVPPAAVTSPGSIRMSTDTPTPTNNPASSEPPSASKVVEKKGRFTVTTSAASSGDNLDTAAGASSAAAGGNSPPGQTAGNGAGNGTSAASGPEDSEVSDPPSSAMSTSSKSSKKVERKGRFTVEIPTSSSTASLNSITRASSATNVLGSATGPQPPVLAASSHSIQLNSLSSTSNIMTPAARETESAESTGIQGQLSSIEGTLAKHGSILQKLVDSLASEQQNALLGRISALELENARLRDQIAQLTGGRGAS